MRTRAHIVLLLALAATSVRAEEVLPALSEEKMSEYKNAFGKAISDSLDAEAKHGRPNGQLGGGPARGDQGLSNVTKHLRDDMDRKGPPPGAPPRPGQGPGPGGPGQPGGDHRPPGFGGPGQPGGPGGPGGPPPPFSPPPGGGGPGPGPH